MVQEIEVPAVVREKTFIGKVDFPVAVPLGLGAMITLPEDLQAHAAALGLDDRAVKFLFGVLRGKCAMTAEPNLPDLAPRLGLTFDEIDAIVRDLIKKNYARFNDRLDLYRLWVVLLHLKGIRFVPGEE
jgi:hypothetical protein